MVTQAEKVYYSLLDIKKYADDALGMLPMIEQHIKSMKPYEGISLLSVKSSLMLHYISNLTYLTLRKVSSHSTSGDAARLRLATIRTVLEKIRPIEHKLQYQIDKLIKIANRGALDANDPLHYKPNPENMVLKGANESEGEGASSSDEETGAKQKGGKRLPDKYIPPKLVAMHYEEGPDRGQRAEERRRRRAINSELMQDLHEQYSHSPLEMPAAMELGSGGGGVGGRKQRRLQQRLRDRVDYEEANLMRVQLGKKQLRAERSQQMQSRLDALLDITRFPLADEPDGGGQTGTVPGAKNGRGGSKPKKFGKKGFKKKNSGGKRKKFKK